jgi:hypothetical protein
MLSINQKDWLAARALEVASLLDSGKTILKGRRVRLRRGKYKDRRGIVNDVMFDPHKSQWRALVSIYRRDGKGFLDGDGDTRSYWLITELDFMDDAG